jgi:hypothetical protein
MLLTLTGCPLARNAKRFIEGLPLSVSGLCSLKSIQKRYYLRALLCPAAQDDRGFE